MHDNSQNYTWPIGIEYAYSNVFTLTELCCTHVQLTTGGSVCVPVSLCKSSSRAERSRNPAISKKSCFPPSSSAASAKIYPATKGSHKASPLIRAQPWHDCISSFQSCAKIPCLLYQYSSLWQPHKHRDTIFLPALCEQMNKVQGHSQFLMLSYLVPKFLSSEIRSLCSEVSS